MVKIIKNDDRLVAVIIFHRELLSLDLFQDFIDGVVILNLIFHKIGRASCRERV